LYELQYPARGEPALAEQILDLLHEAGISAVSDGQRPFDHGAWVPMRHMLPSANVPLVQVSLPADVQTADVYAIGQALSPLREQGVLLMGSGSMTHNLYELRREDGPTEPYVLDFCAWVEAHLRQGDLASLLDYRRLAPHAERAHPTDEHFRTIFFALGASNWGQGGLPSPEYISHEVVYQSLSMDAFSMH
jgi:4,5-DOPA dioxygenase extradiol